MTGPPSVRSRPARWYTSSSAPASPDTLPPIAHRWDHGRSHRLSTCSVQVRSLAAGPRVGNRLSLREKSVLVWSHPHRGTETVRTSRRKPHRRQAITSLGCCQSAGTTEQSGDGRSVGRIARVTSWLLLQRRRSCCRGVAERAKWMVLPEENDTCAPRRASVAISRLRGDNLPCHARGVFLLFLGNCLMQWSEQSDSIVPQEDSAPSTVRSIGASARRPEMGAGHSRPSRQFRWVGLVLDRAEREENLQGSRQGPDRKPRHARTPR